MDVSDSILKVSIKSLYIKIIDNKCFFPLCAGLCISFNAFYYSIIPLNNSIPLYFERQE